MKYLKIFEKFTSMILYHGAPFEFKKFKDQITFFSTSARFAEDYAVQKSQENQMDADIHLYKVEFNGDIFNINDEEDFNKLKEVLPDSKIRVHSYFGMGQDLDKDEILLNMKGFYSFKPIEAMKDKNIEEEFYWNGENYYVLDKTKEKILITPSRHIRYDMENAASAELKYGDENKNRHLFDNWRKYIKDIAEKCTGKSISDLNARKFWYWNTQMDKKFVHLNLTDEEIQEGERLYNDAKNKIIELNKEHGEWYSLIPCIEELGDTWVYFENETVAQSIKNLGYDGYVAREKEKLTYAIFEPNKTTKIIEIG